MKISALDLILTSAAIVVCCIGGSIALFLIYWRG